MRAQYFIAADRARVAPGIPAARTHEVTFAQQVDQRAFESVVVAGDDALACLDVVAQATQRPQIRVEGVREARGRRELLAQVVHEHHERVDRSAAIEWPALPRRAEVAPVGELPARAPQTLDRVAVERAAPQRPAQPFRWIFELLVK